MLPYGFHRTLPGEGMARPYYDVQGPTVHGPLVAIILADQLVEGLAHFLPEAKKHVPCTMASDCPHCEGHGRRRKAYIAAVTKSTRQPFVLELTNGAIDQLHKLTAGKESLRGLVVRLERRQNKRGERSRQAKVIVSILGHLDGRTLPPAFDEAPHLNAMWGLTDDNQESASIPNVSGA